jgi:hypothetical protein
VTLEVSVDMVGGSWSVLDVPVTDELASIPLDLPGSPDIRVALDAAGNRHLLALTSAPATSWIGAPAPLSDCVRTLGFGSQAKRYLDVRCSDPALFAIFDELVVDVLSEIPDPTRPGVFVAQALERWRRLFRAVSGARFPVEKEYGLFAELYVLSELENLVGPRALPSWVGPLGAPHDFELASGCVEVKGVGLESTTVTVHGLTQLEPHDARLLSLIVLTLVESESGETVADLVTSLEGRLDEIALETKLGSTGYRRGMGGKRLTVADVYVVPITKEFAAVTATAVGPKVTSVVHRLEYDLDLAHIQDAAAPTHMAELLTRMAAE